MGNLNGTVRKCWEGQGNPIRQNLMKVEGNPQETSWECKEIQGRPHWAKLDES